MLTSSCYRLAKQKRERLRSAHLAPDYVPLGGASGLADLESRLNPEGNLRAERDEGSGSGSDEEDPDRRMQFIGRSKKRGDDEAGGLFSHSREPQVFFICLSSRSFCCSQSSGKTTLVPTVNPKS